MVSSVGRARRIGLIARRLCVLFAACTAVSASGAESHKPLCDEFRRLVRGDGIDRYQLPKSEQPDSQQYTLDVDGDGVNDVVRSGCSIEARPASPCEVNLEMSSGRRVTYVFEANERLFLVSYKSQFYVMVTDRPAGGSRRSRDVFSLGAKGMVRICSAL